METCQQIAKLLSDYVDEELDPDERKEVDQHMDDCPPCLEFLQEFKATVAVARRCKMKDMPDEMRSRLHELLQRKMAQRGGS